MATVGVSMLGLDLDVSTHSGLLFSRGHSGGARLGRSVTRATYSMLAVLWYG